MKPKETLFTIFIGIIYVLSFCGFFFINAVFEYFSPPFALPVWIVSLVIFLLLTLCAVLYFFMIKVAELENKTNGGGKK